MAALNANRAKGGSTSRPLFVLDILRLEFR
jgi:hypothetical protein